MDTAAVGDGGREDDARPFVIGHRTVSPTVAARYVAAGVTYLELDVRAVDGRILVTHFGPVRGTRGRLERDNLRLRRHRDPPRDGDAVGVLAGLPDGARVLFDPKDRDPAVRARLADGLAALVGRPERHAVSTRHRGDLAAFAAAGFVTWWTLDTPADIRRAVADGVPADGVSVRQSSLTAAAVGSLHTATGTVVAWTVSRIARARELVAFGVDGVTTHDSDVMAALRG